MPQRPIGVTDLAPAADVANYRVRERTVGGVLVGEQHLVLADSDVRHSARAFTNFRTLGRATVAQNLLSIANHTGSGRIAKLRRLTLQMDSTAIYNPMTFAPPVRLYRGTLPALGVVGGQVASSQPFDTANPPTRPLESAYRQRVLDLGPKWYIPLNGPAGSPVGHLEVVGGTAAAAQHGMATTNGPGVFVANSSPFGGTSLEINNHSQGLYFNDAARFNVGGDFTLIWWQFTVSIPNGSAYLFHKSYSTNTTHTGVPFDYGVAQPLATAPPRVSTQNALYLNAQTVGLSSSRSAPVGRWQHMAVIRSTTGDWRLYVDGVYDRLVGTTTTGSVPNNVEGLTLGNPTQATVAPSFRLSHMAAFNRVLTAQEIFDLYRLGAPYIEVRSDGHDDGFNGAGTASAVNDPIPFTPTAGTQMVAQLPMRMQTAAEQVQMEDAVLLGVVGEPILIREGEMLMARLEASAATSNPITNHYLFNAVVDELVPV